MFWTHSTDYNTCSHHNMKIFGAPQMVEVSSLHRHALIVMEKLHQYCIEKLEYRTKRNLLL